MGLGRVVGGLFATAVLAWGVLTSSGCSSTEVQPIQQTQSQPQTLQEKVQTKPEPERLFSEITKYQEPTTGLEFDAFWQVYDNKKLTVSFCHSDSTNKKLDLSLRYKCFLDEKEFENITEQKFLTQIKQKYEKESMKIFKIPSLELAKKIANFNDKERLKYFSNTSNEIEILKYRKENLLLKIVEKIVGYWSYLDWYDSYKFDGKELPQLIVIGEIHGKGTSNLGLSIENLAPENSYICIEDSENYDNETLPRIGNLHFAVTRIERSDIRYVGVDTDTESKAKCTIAVTQCYISLMINYSLENNKELNNIDNWFIKYFELNNKNLKTELKKYKETQKKEAYELAEKRDESIIKNVVNEVKKRKVPGFVILGGRHVDNKSNRDIKDDLLLQELKKQNISYLCLIYENNDDKIQDKKGKKILIHNYQKTYWDAMLGFYFDRVLEKTKCPFTKEQITKHYMKHLK